MVQRAIICGVLLCLYAANFAAGFSEKGKKFAGTSNQNDLQEATTDDPFGFGSDDDENDPFADDSEEDEGGKQLPPCGNLTSSKPCTNETKTEPPRFPDLFLQRLIVQVWGDFQAKLGQDSRLRGVLLDPLDVDALLPKPISLKQRGSMYQADVTMSGMKLHGLSAIALDKASVTRGENLTDLAVDVRFAFESLLINGSYSMKGNVGWWALDSQGEQDFNISMVNATFSFRMTMEVVDGGDHLCGGPDGNALITSIEMPLDYDDIDFRFNNLGAFANTVVNGVGIYFLQTQEALLISQLRKAIKNRVNSLIC